MKITKQRLKEIIKEEVKSWSDGYESLPGGGLRWAGSAKRGAPLDQGGTKKLFLQMKNELGLRLSADEQFAAMTWIRDNWRQWETRPEAEEAIRQWLESGGSIEENNQ
jgi:hypothetical protein